MISEEDHQEKDRNLKSGVKTNGILEGIGKKPEGFGEMNFV